MTSPTRAVALVAGALVAGLLAIPSGPATASVRGDDTPDPVLGDSTGSLAGGVQPERQDQPVTRLIVRTASGSAITEPVRTAAADLAGVDVAAPLRRIAGGATVLSLSGAVSVAKAWDVARALTARADVAYAEPDLLLYPSATSPVIPNDPSFPAQWNLWDTSAASAGGYSSKAAAAWTRTTGSPSVVVAVIDTGITGHADLVGQTVPGYDFVSNPLTGNDPTPGRDGDPSDPGDWTPAAESANFASPFYGCPTTSSWHGTHVAGIIAASQSNGVGISGIAPDVKVQPVRALGRCFGYSSDIADAIEWASGGTVAGAPSNPNPADVVNLSLGGVGVCEAAGTMQRAITRARARGVTVVAAAGNEGQSITAVAGQPGSGSVPANCAGVIRVVATGRGGELAGYSNVGSAAHPADLAAQGGNGTAGILSTVDSGTTSPRGDSYAYYQGTSMAAPHVSAAVALIQSLVSPRLTPDEVRARLRATTTPFPRGNGCTPALCGAGILDIGASLPTVPSAPPEVEAAGSAGAVDLAWEAPESQPAPLTGFHIIVSADAGATWSDVGTVGASSEPSLRVTSYPGGVISDGVSYVFRVSALNSVGEGPSTASNAAIPGLVTVPARAAAPLATGGVERLAMSWVPPADGGSPITGYSARYRIVGSASWVCVPGGGLPCPNVGIATSTDITTWPTPFQAGRYEVEVAALNAMGKGLYSPSAVVVVTGLTQSATVSAGTLRPFRDGFQDSVRLAATSNMTTSGSVRILNSAGSVVRTYPLGRSTRWSITWAGTDGRGRRVPDGTYRVETLLQARSSTLTRVASRPVLVANSRATKPAVRVTTSTVFPYRDGYRDVMAIRTSATVPATTTWTILRKGRAVWSRSFTRRAVAASTWNGRDRRGRPLPVGAYTLRVSSTGGEGRAAVSVRTITISAKRARKVAFTVSGTAGSAARYGFGGGALPSRAGTSVDLPAGSFATFSLPLPPTATTYSAVSIVSCGSAAGSPRPQLGYYVGAENDPVFTGPRVTLRSGCVRGTAASVAVHGRALRWWVANADTGSSIWRVTRFVVNGTRIVLA